MTTNNPLMTERRQAPSRDLEAHCAALNALNWVRLSGLPFFVSERVLADGSSVRTVDRRDYARKD